MTNFKDARAPEGLRIYAIGDIHGRLDLLRGMHRRIAADIARRPCRSFRVIHLGDYVDRGPDSAGVIEELIEFSRDGDSVCLAGNHDLVMREFLRRPTETGDQWLAFGGEETLASYGVEALARGVGLRPLKALSKELDERLPASHRLFLEGLPFCERHGDYFFTHAGVRPGVPLERQRVGDLTFIREPFLSSDASFGAVVIHGHTVVERPCIRANRVGIDTKAYASDVLTCLVLEEAEKGFLEATGYAAIDPAAAK